MTFIPMTQSEWIQALGADKFLEVSAKLAQKKAKARKMIAGRTIKKDKVNGFDKYSYLSEAGYKALINDVFTACGLELTATEVSMEKYEVPRSKQPNACFATWAFQTTDIDTGYYETSIVTGNGMDKGDKAIYKADTGAMKYFAANNWFVVTGDDPEAESPDFISKEEKSKASAEELSKLLVEVTRIKTEANEAGIDVRDPNIIGWLKDKAKVSNDPKTAPEAKRYLAAVRKLIEGKKGKQDAKVS